MNLCTMRDRESFLRQMSLHFPNQAMYQNRQAFLMDFIPEYEIKADKLRKTRRQQAAQGAHEGRKAALRTLQSDWSIRTPTPSRLEPGVSKISPACGL